MENTGFGSSSLQNNTTGNYNLALGAFALRYRNGNNNVAIGYESAGGSVTTIPGLVSNNVLVGGYSGHKNSGTGNVFIGYEAGRNEVATNNTLIIHNSASTPPLLFGRFDLRNFSIRAFTEVADSSVLMQAAGNIPVLQNNPPLSGSGRRTMWYVDKAAFRTGYVSGQAWNKDSIGNYSLAAGRNTRAAGTYSVASGNGSRATGETSLAAGDASVASNSGAIALGKETVASGENAFAAGNITQAGGENAFAINSLTNALGRNALAAGSFNNATGSNATVFGHNAVANAFSGFVTGTFNNNAVAANALNLNQNNRIFQIGNGINNATRNNALTVLQNGNGGVNTEAPQVFWDINGDIAYRQQTINIVSGLYNNVAPGQFSFLKVEGAAGPFQLSGFAGGQDGKILTVINLSPHNMTIINDNASNPANRILTQSGANIITTGSGSVTMQYSVADSRWIVIAYRL
jgi:hypothetical protein